MNSCGTCTLCCTLMKVDMQPPKPERTRCACLSAIGGCSIYDRRPQPCRAFMCFWLAFGRDDRLRPDRTGVVLEINSARTVIAHCEGVRSWKREPMRSALIQLARQTTVMLNLPGRDSVLLTAAGKIEALQFVGLDATTNERLYVRVSELEQAHA